MGVWDVHQHLVLDLTSFRGDPVKEARGGEGS